jgi:hypothetical protein
MKNKIIDRISKVIYFDEESITIFRGFSDEMMGRVLCVYEDAFGNYNINAMSKSEILKKYHFVSEDILNTVFEELKMQ